MNSWRITQIHLVNFKGFKEKTVPLNENEVQAIILGGKNGFGKTTLFDAIELVLTGAIERYKTYKEECVDSRRSRDMGDLPLVFDPSWPEVRVDLYVSFFRDEEREDYILTRKALTEEMKNPVDFSAFSTLYYRKDEKDELDVATDEVKIQFGIADFCRFYQQFHYLSQEEAVSFLKQKETERAKSINMLFDTSFYDEKLGKISQLQKILKSKNLKDTEVDLNNVESSLKLLSSTLLKQSQDQQSVFFEVLFQKQIPELDEEHPNLDEGQYNELLKEGGVFDRIVYFYRNRQEYLKWRKNKAIQSLLGILDDLSFYVYYAPKEKEMALFREYANFLVTFKALSLPTVLTYELILPTSLLSLLSDVSAEELQKRLADVQSAYRNETNAQKIYSELQAQRNKLARHLQLHAVQMGLNACPLCGQTYQDAEHLLKSISVATEMQESLLQQLNNISASAYELFVHSIENLVIAPSDLYFREKKLSGETVRRYYALNRIVLQKHIDSIATQTGKAIELGETQEATADNLSNLLHGLLQEYNESLDYESLSNTYDKFYRHIPADRCNEEAIVRKRSYLLMQWMQLHNRLTDDLQQKKKHLEQQIDKYNLLSKQLKQLKKDIEKQKQRYLANIVGDIEILFYIYSGRIMQDCYYGRGLFMKIADQKYVSFVSNYSSDVDVLFNMSSGQLVVVMISLLLALNKLYATVKFLAIDDPIQTIDDMNLWGFIETLRHEFKDTTLLMSTHEPTYGGLLRYKLDMMQIPALYLDMKEARNN